MITFKLRYKLKCNTRTYKSKNLSSELRGFFLENTLFLNFVASSLLESFYFSASLNKENEVTPIFIKFH